MPTFPPPGSDFAPTLFGDRRDRNLPRPQVIQGRGDVIAPEIEFVPVTVLGAMEGRFERGHGKNGPAMPGINVGERQNIAEKRAVGFPVFE